MKYELWQSTDGSITDLIRIDENIDAQRNIQEPGSVLPCIIAADTWTEARQRQHSHLGWPPYLPAE